MEKVSLFVWFLFFATVLSECSLYISSIQLIMVLFYCRRRVCTYKGDRIELIPTRQSYRRPFYSPKLCSNNDTCENSTRYFQVLTDAPSWVTILEYLEMFDINLDFTIIRVYMRIAYRTVFRKRVIPGEYKRCCPGWTKENPRDLACLARKKRPINLYGVLLLF